MYQHKLKIKTATINQMSSIINIINHKQIKSIAFYKMKSINANDTI